MYGKTLTSTNSLLTITNRSPYKRANFTMPSKLCAPINRLFRIKLPTDCFIDDDMHPLTYSLITKPAVVLSTLKLYHNP